MSKIILIGLEIISYENIKFLKYLALWVKKHIVPNYKLSPRYVHPILKTSTLKFRSLLELRNKMFSYWLNLTTKG